MASVFNDFTNRLPAALRIFRQKQAVCPLMARGYKLFPVMIDKINRQVDHEEKIL